MNPEFRSEGILHVTKKPSSVETESGTIQVDSLGVEPELSSYTVESKEARFETLKDDLQANYTNHLKSIEDANMEMVKSVVKNAQYGFTASLVLNISSFILGVIIIIAGLFLLLYSPETLGQTIGIVSSLIGLTLVISLLFWRGPLERILKSAANLAQINAISLGLAHELNQISRTFVHHSLTEKMDIETLKQLNTLVESSVQGSVKELMGILPEETVEETVRKIAQEQMKLSPSQNQLD